MAAAEAAGALALLAAFSFPLPPPPLFPSPCLDQDGLAGGGDVDLLGTGDPQVAQVALELRVGGLQVEQGLQLKVQPKLKVAARAQGAAAEGPAAGVGRARATTCPGEGWRQGPLTGGGGCCSLAAAASGCWAAVCALELPWTGLLSESPC